MQRKRVSLIVESFTVNRAASWRRIRSLSVVSLRYFSFFFCLALMSRLAIIVVSLYDGLINSRLYFSRKKTLLANTKIYFFSGFKVFERGQHAHEGTCSSVQPIKPIRELTRVNRYLMRRLTSYRFAKLLFVRDYPRFWVRDEEMDVERPLPTFLIMKIHELSVAGTKEIGGDRHFRTINENRTALWEKKCMLIQTKCQFLQQMIYVATNDPVVGTNNLDLLV